MRVLPILPRTILLQGVVLVLAMLAGCANAPRPPQRPETPATSAGARRADPPVVPLGDGGLMLGIDVLEAQGFRDLAGKRVGLLTHPAGVNRQGVSTIDVLRGDSRVNLVALFGPEHGIYGNEKADKYVPDRVDPRTGLHVYSLYGPTRKPTPAMLRGLDVLVVDLQDIGVRSYTFVSCMRLALEACFENDVTVVVLDRPNPLGGLKVSGPPMDEAWKSYVGAFRVPYVHGLTIGELAIMARHQPGVLNVPDEVREKGRLIVVPMRGWRRAMTWPQTGLTWVPTSPNIPSFDAVVGYAMTGLGAQLGGFRHGIGTPYPFRLLSHPAIPANQLAQQLAARRLPGLGFSLRQATDAQGRATTGVYVEVTDWTAWRPPELGFHMMQMAAAAAAPRNPFAQARGNDADLFNKHVGSSAWWAALTRDGPRVNVAGFYATWEVQAQNFQQQSRAFWRYEP